MGYKKSIIFLILTIFLFSIASVCASDVSDTVIAGEDTQAIEFDQIDEISTTDESQTTIETNGTEVLTAANEDGTEILSAANEETTAAENNPDRLSLEEKTYTDSMAESAIQQFCLNTEGEKSHSRLFDSDSIPAEVSVKVDNITYGDKAVIEVTVPVDATGNVTVTIGEKSYTENVSSSKAIFIVTGIASGNYTVNATYNGDLKYDSGNNFTKLEVSKVKIDEKDIFVVDYCNGTIVVAVFKDATGNITVNVGEHTYNSTLVDGKTFIFFDDETPGEHDIDVIYWGDENHEGNSIASNISVPKYDTPLSVDAQSIECGETAVITVTVPENATGNVSVEIDGVRYDAKEIHDGVAEFTIKNLNVGIKTFVIYYTGDDNYASNHTTANITVSKANPEIKMNLTFNGDTVSINVTAPEDVMNPVLLNLDGIGCYVNITDGKGDLVIGGLAGGLHEITAKYIGDDRYNQVDLVSESFEVSDIPSELSLKVDNITYGDKAVIEVTVPSDATGNVTVTVGEKSYTENVSSSKAIFIVEELDSGNYTVNATYNGDDKYASGNKFTKLEVSKIKIDEKDIFVVDYCNGTIVVTVFKNATGNITVNVGEKSYNSTLVDGKTFIFFDDETPGEHDIDVIYWGDENHEGNSIASNISVPKYDTPLSVDAQSIECGETAVITVTVPENATGNVSVEIDGVLYDGEEVHDGVAEFTIKNLTAGIRTIAIEYTGDDNYASNHTTANITVSKANPEIRMNIEVDGDSVNIIINAPQDVMKPVLVDFDGVGYYVNMTDGKGKLVIDGLAGGLHEVIAIYIGDDRYNQVELASESFEVSNIPSELSLKVDNITYGDKAVIEVTVPSDATGNVTLTIGKKSYTENVSSSKAIFIVEGLGCGNYTVNATYNGDEKYDSGNKFTKFEVSKVKIDEKDIFVVDYANGTIVVTVFKNATGNITVNVGEKSYNSTLVDGKAVIDFDDETPGTHDISVIYLGDENHEGNSIASNISVPKYDSPLSVDAQSIEYGETAVITVTVPENATGNVSVEIDGVRYDAKEVHDGVAEFTIKNLNVGIKTFVVYYTGDDNYASNHTTANITVSKANPEIRVNLTFNGDTVSINVTAPEDVMNPVLLNLDGIECYVNITDGKGDLVIGGLAGGLHDIVAIYNGDDRYNHLELVSESFEVSNIPSELSLKVDNITYGDKAVIEVTVPSDATGNVTVTIGEKSYTENVSSSKTIFIVEGLGSGNYTVNVTYNGDEKYASGSNVANLEVSKAKIFIKAIDNGNGQVLVFVSENITANVTVKVGDNIYEAAVEDAVAMFDLSNEKVGSHDLEIICSGDENHTEAYANLSITVNKVKTQISANPVTTSYNVNSNLVISLKDVEGNPIGGAEISVDMNGVKTYTTDSNGQVKVSTKGLSPKSYTAKISFDGDDNYEKSSKNIRVTVKKANPKLAASFKMYKLSTKVKKYTITLKDNTGKAISKAKVTLKVNGKTYKATTNSKGKATFNIKLNKKGTFKATVTFNGNRYYNKVSKKVNIKVISTFKTVSKGSKDKAMVKQIQQALKNNGYYLTYNGHYLKIDGNYNVYTEKSVKEFQHDKGLKVTGKVDEKTAKKLGII